MVKWVDLRWSMKSCLALYSQSFLQKLKEKQIRKTKCFVIECVLFILTWKKQRAGFKCRIYFISIWPICTQSIASHLLWYKIFLNFQHKVIIWENVYWLSVVRLDEKKMFRSDHDVLTLLLLVHTSWSQATHFPLQSSQFTIFMQITFLSIWSQCYL